jgi:hypothetical protein
MVYYKLTHGLENITSTTTEIEQLWDVRISILRKSFINTLILSSAPFLGTITIILMVFAVLSRVFTMRKKSRRILMAKNEKILEDFLVLVTYANKKREENQHVFQQITAADRGKSTSLSLSDLNLSDENKVPMILVQDLIARSLANHTNDDGGPNFSGKVNAYVTKAAANSNGITLNNLEKVKMDQEIIKIVNDLIHPQQADNDRNRTAISKVKKTLKEKIYNLKSPSQTTSSSSPLADLRIKLNPADLERQQRFQQHDYAHEKTRKLAIINENSSDVNASLPRDETEEVTVDNGDGLKRLPPPTITVESCDETL